MEVPGEAKPEGDSVFLRNSDGGIQLVVHGASVEGVPASAVNRSGLLQSFAEAGGSETRLDLPIADVREWMSIADGDSIVDRRLLEALNTALRLEDATGTRELAAAAAAYIRRNLRESTADPGGGPLGLLSAAPRLHPLPPPLTARLEALAPAAADSIAQNLLVSEVPYLPLPLRGSLLRRHFAESAGTLALSTAATAADAAQAAPTRDSVDPLASVLEVCGELLPVAAAEPGLRSLRLAGDLNEATARRVLATGALGLTTLQALHLDVGKLPEATVAAIVGSVAAATALTLCNLAPSAAAAAQERREGAGESLAADDEPAGGVQAAAQGTAAAAAAAALDGDKQPYERDPSPGRPPPFPLLRHEPARVATAEELRAAALPEAIGTLTALRRLTLHPTPSAGRRFWSCLEHLCALEALDVAFYGGTDDSSSRSGSPDPPDGSAAPESGGGGLSLAAAAAAAVAGDPAAAARGLVDAREAFLRLQEATALRELQVHASGFTERSEEVLVATLPHLSRLSGLTLQLSLSPALLEPMCDALATLSSLRSLALLLYGPTSSSQAAEWATTFSSSWPRLTAITALECLSLPFSTLTAAMGVYRATHRHLTAFQNLQTLAIWSAATTQATLWLHLTGLTALTALRVEGFRPSAGTAALPEEWLQGVFGAIASCRRLLLLQVCGVSGDQAAWFARWLPALGQLHELEVCAPADGPEPPFSPAVLTGALGALTALRTLRLDVRDPRTPGADVDADVPFTLMQAVEGQLAGFAAALAPLTTLEALEIQGFPASLDVSAAVLGESAAALPALTRLRLEAVPLRGARAAALAPPLGRCTGLRDLTLRTCGLSGADAAPLAAALRSLHSLDRLDVRGNEGLVGEGGRELFDALVPLPLTGGVLL